MQKNTPITKAGNHVVVGISGGVDSSVTALLLKQQGYSVTAIFMQNWTPQNDDPYCYAQQDLSDARAVCDEIGIPLHTVNFSQEYWDRVFQYCLDEFTQGRTPNPDIWCNREIKFNVFLEHAKKLGANYLATGHYANVTNASGQYYLCRAADTHKDQTYFLYTLGQNQLKHCLFPLGQYQKTEVREIAEKNKLINYAKKDSTGICFIGERKFKDFLQEFIIAQPGNIETPEGKVIGKHDGVMFYTLGQRKGLNIGGKKNFANSAWYVVSKEVKRNVLIVGQGYNHPLLYSQQLTCNQLHWVNPTQIKEKFSCTAKTRYHQQEQACQVEIHDENATVQFNQPQRAITPGQSVVFYQGDYCLGGGIII